MTPGLTVAAVVSVAYLIYLVWDLHRDRNVPWSCPYCAQLILVLVTVERGGKVIAEECPNCLRTLRRF
ncbi:MAG: hypothetical protein V3S43_06180 [Acidimicrobiia bacterium]